MLPEQGSGSRVSYDTLDCLHPFRVLGLTRGRLPI
jgi:hypothetical protein